MAERSPRKRRLLRRFALLFGVLLVADLALTNATRHLRVDPRARDRALRTASDVYHHGLRSNVTVEGLRWGPHEYTAHTNSLGFKDERVREVELEPLGERVLIIGDSFTEGLGFPFEQTFAGLMATALAPDGVEVLNAGVVSYAPSIYYAKTRHLIEEVGLRFDELYVFLDVSDLVDEVERYRLRADGRVFATQAAANRNARLGRRLEHWFKANFVATNWMLRLPERLFERREVAAARPVSDRVAWTLDDAEFARLGDEAVDRLREGMDRLLALTRAQAVRMTLVVYPWPDQVLRTDIDSRHVRVWSDWAGQNGVDFVDLFPAFLERGDPLETVQALYIEGDDHFNAAGHRLVAERVLRRRSER